MPLPSYTRGNVEKILVELNKRLKDPAEEVSDNDALSEVAMALLDFIWYLGIEAATADATLDIPEPIEMDHINKFVERFLVYERSKKL